MRDPNKPLSKLKQAEHRAEQYKVVLIAEREKADKLRAALEMCERHFKRNQYPKTHPARRVIAAALS